MTYQTNNPVGSVDVRDLYDNAEAFDNFSAGPLDAYPDRFGVSRQSLQGIRNASQYVDLGPYAAGLVFTSRNQVFSYLGEFYAPGPAITLPYTTTGAGAGEIANFRSVGDAVLRADLLASDGAGRIGYKVSAPGGVAHTVASALDNRNAYPYQFGAVGDGVADDTAAWLAALATGKLVDGLGKTYLVTTLTIPSDHVVIRANFILPAGSTNDVHVIKVDGKVTPKQNITLWDIHVNGNRQNRTNIAGPEAGDGELSGFSIQGVVDNVIIRDCSASYCGTDGLALFGAGAGVSLSLTNITVENFTARFNRRHGVSLDVAKGVKFIGGKWNSNGLDLDTVSPLDSGMRGARFGGNLYGNGVDVEGYGATVEYSTHVEDVSFYDVECIKNYGMGMQLLPSPSGYALPLWRPFVNISVYGGHFDQGIAPASSERSSIQVSSVGAFAAGQVAVDGFNVFGARLENGIGMNYVRGANINAYVAFPNGGAFTYHAFVQNCIRAHLNLTTPQTQLIYQDRSTLTYTVQPSVPGEPTIVAGDARAQVNSQTATLVSASADGGYLYRIVASVQLIGDSATAATSFVLGGPRAIMDAHATAGSSFDGTIIPFHFNPAGLTLNMKPGTFAALTMVAHVTVK